MRILTPFIVALLIASCARGPEAESAAPSPNAASETKAATAKESSAPFFEAKADAAEGKVLVTLPPPDENGVMLRAIHTSGLTAGLGSNPVGLDRGFADEGRIIAFRKIGKKVIVEQEKLEISRERREPA
ncbi:MAG: hypothetical protein R3C54_09105 [Parvularculaceae bacterium]